MPKLNLKNLILKLKLDYINNDITEANFPDDGRLIKEVKIFHFDKLMSSKEVIEEMKKENYVPANLRELLVWGKKEWDRKEWVVAFGSVWQCWYGDRHVAYLDSGAGERDLDLSYFDVDWHEHYRFLAVRESIVPSDTLTPCKNCKELEKKLERIKEIIE